MSEYFTVGKLALAVGAQEHQIRRLAAAGKLPHVHAGIYRMFAASDLPVIRKALVDAGFIKAEQPPPPGSAPRPAPIPPRPSPLAPATAATAATAAQAPCAVA